MSVAAGAGRLFVACLCAAWCGACRDYRATFDALAARFAAEADFAWVDIEDEADALGDLDVENFPTLMIASGAALLFAGAVTPQPQAAERLVRSALAGTLSPASGSASSSGSAPATPHDLPQRVRRAVGRS